MYVTTNFASQYRALSDDELLQIWNERVELSEEARQALRAEIDLRQLSREADTPLRPQPTRQLAPPVYTYGDVTVLFWWLRELWLRVQTRDGPLVPATIESTSQTRRRFRSATRAELRYVYEFQGTRYSGRSTRDSSYNQRAADALAFGRKPGETISVQVNPQDPSRSYYPSGFGWIEPLLYGTLSLLVASFWIGLAIAAVLFRLGLHR
jgi:hypothetical protein